jgi:hypothetical protein
MQHHRGYRCRNVGKARSNSLDEEVRVYSAIVIDPLPHADVERVHHARFINVNLFKTKADVMRIMS